MTIFIGLAGIISTVLLYYGSKILYRRNNLVVFSPMLAVPLAIVTSLLIFHISYANYSLGGKWLTVFLQPAIVAFALPLHKHYRVFKKYFPVIACSVLAGSLSALLTSIVLGVLADFSPQIIISLAPRSVTTPIAMGVSQALGGTPALTALFVIVTGLIGLILGPSIIRLLRLNSPIAKGILLGTSAHAVGTSTALEIGSLEGTIASISMILAGLITIVLAPLLCPLILRVI